MAGPDRIWRSEQGTGPSEVTYLRSTPNREIADELAEDRDRWKAIAEEGCALISAVGRNTMSTSEWQLRAQHLVARYEEAKRND